MNHRGYLSIGGENCMNIKIFIGAILVVALLSLTGHASVFKLSDTGQTTCFDGAGTLISCASGTGLGQDGAYLINPMSFTDNGDGTVTDNNTGLMWQQTDDGIEYNWYKASGTYNQTYNPTSVNVCGSLNLAGYSDWRLPAKKELISIVDYSHPKPGPTIDWTYFPECRQFAYWSSTVGADEPDHAWDVVFHNGGAGSKFMYLPVMDGKFPYVRCVRGGE